MRIALFAFFLAALPAVTGCAAGFRASGPHGGGVKAGAAVGQPVVEQPLPRP